MKNPSRLELVELLRSKYESDPEAFRKFMPEVAQLLESAYPRRQPPRSPFGLTERERDHHLKALAVIMGKAEDKSASLDNAVKGLQHCATLIQDDSLPQEMSYKRLVRLLKAAVGKSPGSFKSITSIPIGGKDLDTTVSHVPIVRGVTLDLDNMMSLVSVTITPSKVGQRQKLLKFVGSGRDSDSDVALRHDYYIAEQNPHATA